MKKVLLFSGLLLLIINVCGQDVILLRTGDEILGKVTAVKPEHIEYRKSSSPDGPLYELMKYEIFKIIYENGRSELYSSYKKTAPASEKTSYQAMVKKEKKEIVVDNVGFTSINSIQAGTFLRWTSWGRNSAPSVYLTSINGFQFKPKAFWGVGTGFEISQLGGGSVNIPLFFNMAFDLNEKVFRPFISPSLGAEFLIPTGSNSYEDFNVSPFVGLGFGGKKYLSEKRAFIFSVNTNVHPLDDAFYLTIGLKLGLSF